METPVLKIINESAQTPNAEPTQPNHSYEPYGYTDTPLIKSGEHNLKNLVIAILSQQWPLNSRQIYREISAEHYRSITYQGVHKAIRQLVEQGIVKKGVEGSRLNYEWIEELRGYSDYLYANYTIGKNTNFYGLVDGDSVSIEYDNYFLAVRAILEMMNKEHEKNPEKDVVVFELPHPLPIMGMPTATLRQMFGHKRSNKASFHGFYRHSSPSDLQLARLWQTVGVSSRLDGTANQHGARIITRDLIIQLIASSGSGKRMGAAFKDGKKMMAENLLKYTQISHEPETKTVLLITKNPGLAEQLRKEAMKETK